VPNVTPNITSLSSYCPATAQDVGLVGLDPAVVKVITDSVASDVDGSVRKYIAGQLSACGQKQAAADVLNLPIKGS
jgi:hypothetical protein